MIVDPITIQEMRRLVAKDDCNKGGHSFDVISTMSTPTRIVCSRCGESWKVGDNG